MKRTFIILLALLLCSLHTLAEAFPQDFILGVDVSELLAQEASGAVYRNASGSEADALAILADSGVGHIRVRVWNDPFDADGNGYGGGNADIETAAILSARAAALGIKTLVDFHYSDFWADPTRQLPPKAWTGMSADEKANALYAYTVDALNAILDAGGDVDMVQVGNETNNGIAGESSSKAVGQLIASGCAAVREVAAARGIDIQISVHLTDPQNCARIDEYLSNLEAAGADYDAVALSYYPYWHGAPSILESAVNRVRDDHGKAVFVAETAWPFTLEDGDGWPNVIGEDPDMYPVTAEGQAQALVDVCRAAAETGAEGVFYWGGIWTPVGPDADENWDAWERYGSGWASSFAAGYDPDHVGDDYGGCAWDNQALFDFDGNPLPVLNALRQLADGDLPDTPSLIDANAAEAPAEDDGENLVVNPGFEDADRSMWIAESATGDIPFDYQDFVNDAHTGTVAFHYWSERDMDFTITQTLSGLEPGVYQASAWSQGGDMKDAALTLFIEADGQRYEAPFMNTSWANWQHPVVDEVPVSDGTLTIGVHIVCGAKGWGTLDDFDVRRLP
ncbi:MAG: glycosyl hydrolase 53 family protein [Clostridia bacterium]|nr:glycosyl hydrolase 53 family protein [Clostridia bacterium]